jgi:hypothetical protein
MQFKYCLREKMYLLFLSLLLDIYGQLSQNVNLTFSEQQVSVFNT